jgi:hypothetical protein
MGRTNTLLDLILTPFYLLLVFVIASYIQRKHEHKNPVYRYFRAGAMAKAIGAVALCLIYTLYYDGGDTVNYFDTSYTVLNLWPKYKSEFFDVMMGHTTMENYSLFDNDTEWPFFWFDDNAMFVSRFITPLCFLAFKTFIPTAILLSFLCYSGIWKMYLLFTDRFPSLTKQLAIAILFIPSVVFWGSGILKDTITISCVGWYAYIFHELVIRRRYKIWNILGLVVSCYLLIMIKPYILFALLPGSLIWWSNERVAGISNNFLRAMATPFLLAIGLTLGYLALTKLDFLLGFYKIDEVMDRASVVQKDLKQSYYGGNSFDIGDYDPTFSGMMSKAHLAISAALFRPGLWDVRNPVMFLSAIENTYVMFLTIFLMIRLKFLGFFRLILKDPLLLFSVMFSLFFAFSVGISISNFGALVRLRIPCVPFFVASLFILKYYYDQSMLPRRHRQKLPVSVGKTGVVGR